MQSNSHMPPLLSKEEKKGVIREPQPKRQKVVSHTLTDMCEQPSADSQPAVMREAPTVSVPADDAESHIVARPAESEASRSSLLPLPGPVGSRRLPSSFTAVPSYCVPKQLSLRQCRVIYATSGVEVEWWCKRLLDPELAAIGWDIEWKVTFRTGASVAACTVIARSNM